MKKAKTLLALLLAICMVLSVLPGYAFAAVREEADRSVHGAITIDDDPTDGYRGDYVVIYNPSTSPDDAYSTGTMNGRIETEIAANTVPSASRQELYRIDIDAQLAELTRKAGCDRLPEPETVSFQVGDTMTFEIYGPMSPTGDSNMEFKCLYVGEHCYIWTPTSTDANVYPLDTLGEENAALAAAEFDSKFELMQYSFGDHMSFENDDGKLHMLYYNIDDGWQPGRGYVAGFFYAYDLYMNGLPMLNIDTYPGVCYPDYYGEGQDWVRMDTTYNTMVHEYQHLINFSNTPGMDTWLNECFSAAAEEICYPGSSVVSRIQTWQSNYFSSEGQWQNPPSEYAYQADYNLHNGYSLYKWDNDLSDILALYAQVSFFAQYLFTRFGNGIYQQISKEYDGDCVAAISAATGIDCSQLAKEFRVAVTANAAQDQYGGIYGFKVQEGYDPSKYHNVENPWDLLSPVVFTGTSCEIEGGGAITVKPVGGVYVPPADADPNLVYVGILLAPRNSYTLNLVVGSDVIDTQTVYENDSVTLPGEVDESTEGWTFVGWTAAEVAETAETPAYYAAGASYTVTADTTLFALFKHTSGSETLYTTAPSVRHTPVLVPAAPPTCTAAGNVAYYQCSVCGKCFADESCETEITLASTVISATDHTPGEPVKENETAPGCTTPGGYDMVVYCTVCAAELSREHTEIEATGHTAGEPVKENEAAPTCEAVGGYDMTVYCTVCGAELSREHTEIEALGHGWGEPAYVWADDCSTVTATRVCTRDETHVETEIANTTSEVTKPATYEEEGEITYDAVFENEAFAAQTKTVVIPKLVPPVTFSDVTEGAFYADAVAWAVSHDPQITSGTGGGKFSPDMTCSRAQVVTFLWRAMGCPAPKSTEIPFSDVPAGQWYTDAVLWAVENEITGGTGGGRFSPDAPCTRAQVVTFLWRAHEKPAPASQNNPFSDVLAGQWYTDAVLWAVENEITGGTGGGKFSPDMKCSRGQIVTFLYRDLGK